MHILDSISSFMSNPSKEELDRANKSIQAKTAQNLIELSIRNDYHEAMNIIVYDLNEPITNDMIELAIKTGSTKMIKMLLGAKYERIKKIISDERKGNWDERNNRKDLMLQWKSLLVDEENASKYDIEKMISKQHPVFKLQIDCGLTLEDIPYHCESLEMHEPLNSWMEMKFDNLSVGYLWSCENGKEALSKQLFIDAKHKGINVNILNSMHDTGFNLACSNGHINIVEFLLNQNEKKKITINASNTNGENAFFQACANEQTEIVRILLNKNENIDINNVNIAGDNAFHQACAKGQIDIAMILMEDQRINFDERNANGETGLYLAWSNDHLTIVDFIINNLEIDFIKEFQLALNKSNCPLMIKLLNGSESSKHIDLNITDDNGSTFFLLACAEGNLKAVSLLLKEKNSKEFDVNVENEKQENPFLLACSHGHYDVVLFLLERIDSISININTKNKQGENSFFSACSNGYTKIVSLLIDKSQFIDANTMNEKGENSFLLSCSKGQVDIARLLLESSESTNLDIHVVNKKGQTAFWCACSNGHTEIVSLLIDNSKNMKINIDFVMEDGENAFYNACTNGDAEIVTLLMQYSQSEKMPINAKNKEGEHAILQAYLKNQFEIIPLLINDPNAKFLLAFYKRNFHQLNKLVKKSRNKQDIDFNITDNDGNTIFNLACAMGNLNTVQNLINESEVQDIRLNASNKKGEIGFIQASSNGHHEIVNFLLEQSESKGINIIATDTTGDNAFHHACANGHIETVKILLDHNERIDINARNLKGEHAIHQAVINGHVNIVKCLVKEFEAKKIEINAKNNLLETPIQLACSSNLRKFQQVLLEFPYSDHQHIVGLLLKESNPQIYDFHNDAVRNKSAEYFFHCFHGNRFSELRSIISGIESTQIDVNAVDMDGNTGFHHVCLRTNHKAIDILLENSVDAINFNAINNEGNTGFHIVCANGEERIVRTLMENLSPTKIGLKSKNKKGETGLDLARNTLDAELCGEIEELMS